MRNASPWLTVICYRFLLLVAFLVWASPNAAGQTRTYTSNADFDEGSLINLNHNTPNPDQLQLDDKTTAFEFIWIAVSTRGTVVKIDTKTGAVLGEYRSSPDGMGADPSRTTVDNNGSVWVGNRAEFGFVAKDAIKPGLPVVDRSMGSVVHIGLLENGQCVDRNGNNVIDTSTGQGDIRPWTNAGGANTLGGVSTAEDECIIHYTRVNSGGTRHVSVDAANDVWVSGTSGQFFDQLSGATGMVTRQEPSVGYGGYGGLIDGAGVIWSARNLLRWDTSLPLTGPIGGNWDGYSHDSYGLCIDSFGNVWNTALGGDVIYKFAPDGTLLGTFSHGNYYAQGCVVDGKDHVWVAHSLISSYTTVGHLLNDGTYVGNVTVGSGPTGVAVDAAGKVWATNYYDRTASRIDPALGPIGGGGVPIGAVDLTTIDLLGNTYNYSDMTGSTLKGPPSNGTWTVVYNSGTPGAAWGTISWTESLPSDAMLTVTAASSTDGVTFGPPQAVTQNTDLTVANGQYLKISVSFKRASTGESPVLFDLTVSTETDRCETFVALGNNTVQAGGKLGFDITLKHKRPRTIERAFYIEIKDAQGRSVMRRETERRTINYLDEINLSRSLLIPANLKPGRYTLEVGIDGMSHGRAFARERFFVTPGTPAKNGLMTEADPASGVPETYALDVNYPNPFNPETTIRFALPEASAVRVVVYDVMGRVVQTLVDTQLAAGVHETRWNGQLLNGAPAPSGVYIYRMEAGTFSHTRQMTLLR